MFPHSRCYLDQNTNIENKNCIQIADIHCWLAYQASVFVFLFINPNAENRFFWTEISNLVVLILSLWLFSSAWQQTMATIFVERVASAAAAGSSVTVAASNEQKNARRT